jgi:hypothetical protein
LEVTYHSEGPNIDWEYLKKIHPAVQIIRAVSMHMEEEFKTWTRGKKHTSPQKAMDIQRLQKSIAEVHMYEPG